MALDTEFLQSLAAIVGDEHVRHANQLALMDPGIDPDNLAAGLAARPGSADEVAGVLSLCDTTGVPVVTHGGRTGLARGAVSSPGQLVMLTDRLKDLEIDPVERVAEVGTGVTLQALQEAAAEHGLSPGIDTASRGSATVGGLVSTNAGGMEAFRYGMMRQRILGMEAVLADGTILRDLARVPKNNEGYDLRQLFCGSEGTLGVVTRVTLRLERADPPSVTVMCACPDAAAAARVMRDVQDQGGMLRAEIMWREFARRVADNVGLSAVLSFCEAPVYLILETVAGEDGLAEALAPNMDNGAILDAIMAQSAREADDIWRIREDSFAANRTLAHQLWFDISLPLSAFDSYVAALKTRLEEIGGGIVLFALGHLADGNLHVTVGRETRFSDTDATAVALAVEHGVKAAGGSVSAEHGIGTAKLAILARNATPQKIAVMRRLKAALDPNGTMNPGKVIPAR